MAINVRCPKCGSTRVQLSNERSRHGCLMTLLFGFYYLAVVAVRWIIGLVVLCVYDWWAAILHLICGKGHVWQCRKWFSGKKRIFYCHDCGHNFRG